MYYVLIKKSLLQLLLIKIATHRKSPDYRYMYRQRPWTGNSKCFALVFRQSYVFVALPGKAARVPNINPSMPNI